MTIRLYVDNILLLPLSNMCIWF